MNLRRRASFLLPVIDGKIYVGQRNTPPHVGCYGPIGGKSDAAVRGAIFNQPHIITKMGGHQTLSIADQMLLGEGKEYQAETAVREFLEEAFSARNYPDDFSKNDVTDVRKFATLDDVTADTTFACAIFLGHVHRKDFSPSPRELRSIRPLSEIHPHECFPIAQLALYHLLRSHQEGENSFLPDGYQNIDYSAQIKPFEPIIDKMYFTELYHAIRFQRLSGLLL